MVYGRLLVALAVCLLCVTNATDLTKRHKRLRAALQADVDSGARTHLYAPPSIGYEVCSSSFLQITHSSARQVENGKARVVYLSPSLQQTVVTPDDVTGIPDAGDVIKRACALGKMGYGSAFEVAAVLMWDWCAVRR